MPATFKLILAPAPDREGLHDVRLRIIAERVVRYLERIPGLCTASIVHSVDENVFHRLA